MFTDDISNESGTRFFLSYAGSAPTAANCATLASDISAAYTAHLVAVTSADITLKEIDVLDIATRSGASGSTAPGTLGTLAGQVLPIQLAFNMGYTIARRYRGGKPRGYWPFGDATKLQDQSNWTTAFVSTVNSDFAAFMAAVVASSVGSMGALAHVSLSYFHGFTNVTDTSGRTEPVPTYKGTATHDNVTGYKGAQLLSSQRRRRTATTP